MFALRNCKFIKCCLNVMWEFIAHCIKPSNQCLLNQLLVKDISALCQNVPRIIQMNQKKSDLVPNTLIEAYISYLILDK